MDDDPERFARALALFHLAGRVMPDLRLDEHGHGWFENYLLERTSDGWLEVVGRYYP